MTVDDILRRTPLHPGHTAKLFRVARAMVVVFGAMSVPLELVRPTRARWSDLLSYLAMAAWLIPLAFAYLWPARARGRRVGNGIEVRPPGRWRIAIVLGVLVPAGGVILLMGWPLSPLAIGALAVGLVVGSIGVAVLFAQNVVRVSAEGVRESTWWGRTTSLRWEDVTGVDVDHAVRLVLRTGRTRLRCFLGLEGGGDLAAQVLSSLSPATLRESPSVRPVLEAVAARRDAVPGGLSPWTLAPGAYTAASAALVALGLAAWTLSCAHEPRLRVPLPAGWIDLSPGAPPKSFKGVPGEIATQARRFGVEEFAVERPAPGETWGQVVAVYVRNGALDPAAALPAQQQRLVHALPGAKVVSAGVEQVGGVRATRVEVMSPGGGLIAYALPLIAQTATVAFSCLPAECPRLHDLAAATIAGSTGFVEQSLGARWLGPLGRSGALMVLFAGLLLALAAVEAGFGRRAPATSASWSRGTQGSDRQP